MGRFYIVAVKRQCNVSRQPAKVAYERANISRQAYGLYGLTEKEIGVVEFVGCVPRTVNSLQKPVGAWDAPYKTKSLMNGIYRNNWTVLYSKQAGAGQSSL